MVFIIIISFILCIYAKTYDNKIISIELSQSNQFVFRSKNFFSSQNIDISLNDNYTSISTFYFRNTNSTLISINETIFYDSSSYIINLFPNANQIESNIPIPLYFTNNTSLKHLGMGHYFHNTNFSLVHLLHKLNYIKHKSFTLELHYKLFRSNFIYFGGIPHYIQKHRSQLIQIKPIANTIKWGFEMKLIGIRNNVLHIRKKVYFDLQSDKFEMDKEMYEWMRDELFYGMFMDGICDEHKKEDRNEGKVYSRFNCDTDYEMPELVFGVEGKEETVLVFGKDYKECWNVDFYYNEELNGKDYVIFPVNFFYSKVVMFDYDNDMIVIMGSKEGNSSIFGKNERRYGWEVKWGNEDNREMLKRLLEMHSVGLSIFVFIMIIKKEFLINEWEIMC